MSLVSRSTGMLPALFAAGLLAGVLLTAAGCAPEDEIAHYSTPKPESIETPITRPAGMPAMPPGMMPGAGRPSPSASADDLQFEKPEGWTEAPGNAFSMKAFEVVDGDKRIEITISAAGGDLTANMNRWRAQVKLPDVSADELAKLYQPIEVNRKEAKFVEFHSPESEGNNESILGAVLEDGDRTWFIKLRGSTDLANREREHFQAFAKSVTW
jgi:hypothetical protein